jgi:hypothetical protein
MLAKMGGEVLNPEHVKRSPKGQNDAAATGQSAKPTPLLSQSAKPTSPVSAGLDVPESAKPTPLADTVPEAPELAWPTLGSTEPTPTVSVASEVSSDDFALIVAAMVGMEVPEVFDKEMVDYEATLKRGKINVVVLSVDYYIVEDDSAAVVFNFPIQDATFKKPE